MRPAAIALVGLAWLAGAAGAAGEGLPIPAGPEPGALSLPHFPRRLDAYVFRNWGVVPVERIAAAIGAEPSALKALGARLGLGEPPPVTEDSFRRSAITIIRANWHLLPYPQLLALLGWSEGRLGYTLREDDFLWIKLGSLKPRCEPIRWEDPGDSVRERQARIREVAARALAEVGPGGLGAFEPRFAFLGELNRPARTAVEPRPRAAGPLPGEVDLSAGWSIAAGEPLGAAVEGFRAELAAVFGAKLAAAAGPGPAITVQLAPDRFNGPEGHEIAVERERVSVLARDERGARAGLDFLLDRMEERGGPYLAPGSTRREARFAIRFLHSYFALYGDALLEPGLDPYPDEYLERLARLGVNGVWLPVLLRSVAPAAPGLHGPSPADSKPAGDRTVRLEKLREIARRAGRHGVGVYLYLNEPRALPVELFAGRTETRGVTEGIAASLCTSVPEVRRWITDSLTHVFAAVPELAGIFTITASENLTSCWSHQRGKDCPRCGPRAPWDVVAEVITAMRDGVRAAGSEARVIAWDWGWPDDWIEPLIERLPADIGLQSVSEWSLPIRRGGVESTVGEYSISAVGPGPRAERTWRLAKARGHETVAKVQAGNTWELSAVPYIPAVNLAAEHARRLARSGVDGVMLGWTLGGYPSPNLEVFGRYAFREAGGGEPLPADSMVLAVARRRFGKDGDAVAAGWSAMSAAFEEYPYHGGLVYNAPVQVGPANLLHVEKTGYAATMVGIPYDDLDGWRAIYPPEVFAGQFEAVARGWRAGLAKMPAPAAGDAAGAAARAVAAERRVAEAALLHFESVAAQARFILARRRHEDSCGRKDRDGALAALADMERITAAEQGAARRLLALVRDDSRLGFEATNQYYYTPVDLLEKVVACAWIVERWIPEARQRVAP